jgi:hypothetical protein
MYVHKTRCGNPEMKEQPLSLSMPGLLLHRLSLSFSTSISIKHTTPRERGIERVTFLKLLHWLWGMSKRRNTWVMSAFPTQLFSNILSQFLLFLRLISFSRKKERQKVPMPKGEKQVQMRRLEITSSAAAKHLKNKRRWNKTTFCRRCCCCCLFVCSLIRRIV